MMYLLIPERMDNNRSIKKRMEMITNLKNKNGKKIKQNNEVDVMHGLLVVTL